MSDQSPRKAMVVGINKYLKEDKIPSLAGAENDAKELYELLKNDQLGEFDIQEDHLLLGSDATCENIRQALSDLFWQDNSCELVLFFFSGHGFKDGFGNGYIAPYNIDLNHPFVNGINISDLKNIIFSSPNKQSVIIILDCCYSGIATRHNKAIEINARDTIMGLDDKEKDKKWQGKYILASSEEDKKSREREFAHEAKEEPHFHGVLSYFLIEGLKGLAAEEAGIVSFGNLRKYVEENINTGTDSQKVRFFAAESSLLDKIRMAWDSGKIRDKIEEATVCLSSGKSSDLVMAIQCMRDMHNTFGSIKLADEIREKIIEKISEINLQTRVCKCYDKNMIALRKALIRKPYLLTSIIKFNNSMSYDEIFGLTDDERRMLISFCDVETGAMTLDQFLQFLNSSYEKNAALESMKQIGKPLPDSQKEKAIMGSL
jgi:hypothetical protein